MAQATAKEIIEIKLSPTIKQLLSAAANNDQAHGAINYPARATMGSAGFDLMAAITEKIIITPAQRMLIPTGVFLRMPRHMVADVRPRSGLALKHGITVLNTPGTIDSDYRGEVGVVLVNHGDAPFVVEPLARVAQMVFLTLPTVDMVEIVDFADNGDDEANQRKTGGFGSTG
ncbi:MAG: dUTP diphosphatase [Hydrotalea sp.]|nr:dUTP diphosphatase [Hydrotalea sp.]